MLQYQVNGAYYLNPLRERLKSCTVIGVLNKTGNADNASMRDYLLESVPNFTNI